MKIKEVIEILNDKNVPDDTKKSKCIFECEEGKQDKGSKKSRRDWLILADIYNGGKYTQKFHLKNYLQFKLHNGLTENDCFNDRCFRYISNGALRIFIMEAIFKCKNATVDAYYETLKTYYEADKPTNKCPRHPSPRK